MSVQTQLLTHDAMIAAHDGRIAALESKTGTFEGLRIDIERINSYLFGTGRPPQAPRDKSNVVSK